MLAIAPAREDPLPTAGRGWAEQTVEPWIREGTYVNDRSRVAYRTRMLLVPRYLEQLGFSPTPQSPTAFRREHVEALKYRAACIRGPSAGRTLAPKTVGPIISSLKDLLGFWARRYRSAQLLDLVSDSRLWRVRNAEPVRPARALESPEIVDRLLASCDQLTRVGVALGAYSGLRVGDICALEVRDLELSLSRGSWLTVRHGKGGKPRRVPVTPYTRNLLLDLVLGYSPSSRVYPLSPGSFRRRLAMAASAAGIGHVHTHQLRATFIVFALRAGVPEQLIREWVGHQHSETTHGYSRHDPLIESRGRELYEAYVAPRSE